MPTRLVGTAVPITILEGGTGATTAENARNNLGTPGILSSTSGIDALTMAATTLYTVPMGKTAIVTGAVVRCASITGAPATVGTFDVRDSTAANVLIASIIPNNLTDVNFAYNAATSVTFATVPAGNNIALNISGAFTVATAMSLTVELLGYLI